MAGRASHIPECRDRIFDKMCEAGEKRAVDKVEEELNRDPNTETTQVTRKIHQEQLEKKEIRKKKNLRKKIKKRWQKRMWKWEDKKEKQKMWQ